MKYIYIILGSITLTIGILGFVTPMLPVTPFILLTGFLYAKGSPKLYKKLEDNRITGRYLKRMNTGLSIKGLLFSIGFMWCMICITAFVILPYGTWRFVILGMGVIGTIAQYLALGRKRKAETVKIDTVEKIDYLSNDCANKH